MTVPPPESCLIVPQSVRAWHDGLLQSGQMFPDTIQSQAVDLLQLLADQVALPPEPKPGPLSRIAQWFRPTHPSPPTHPSRPSKPSGTSPDSDFSHPSNPFGRDGVSGLYLHGGVGRGKSFLMDGFFLNVRAERKMRAHFHQFMRRFHADMKARENESDPLAGVADDLARRFDLVCFDEFHVSDIADAMILARMLRRMLDGGVRFVTTSNYAPDGLYPNGLARDRFLPAISLLNERLRVFSVDGGSDYRMRALTRAAAYFCLPDGEGEMREVYERLACGMYLPPQIKVAGRVIPAVSRASDAIWFRYEDLCGGARSQHDYLLLAERYAALFVSGVPRMDATDGESSRRFTWLVDVLYDAGTRLIVGAEVPLEKLYGEAEGGESGRTYSRLVEMGSREYLARGRRNGK